MLDQHKKNGHEWEYPISDKELITQTLKLLSLVRNALIYISLAANEEERTKRATLKDTAIGELQLYEVDESYRL